MKGTNRKNKFEKWLEKENLILIEGWRRDGLTYEQIAQNMNIHIGTLYEWLKKYPKLDEALKKGEEVAIYEVENALYKSAIGHYAEDVERVEVKDASGQVVQTSVKGHRRYIPPNTAAAIFILKNRRNFKWRDRPEIIDVESTVDDGFVKALEDKAAEDWDDDTE